MTDLTLATGCVLKWKNSIILQDHDSAKNMALLYQHSQHSRVLVANSAYSLRVSCGFS